MATPNQRKPSRKLRIAPSEQHKRRQAQFSTLPVNASKFPGVAFLATLASHKTTITGMTHVTFVVHPSEYEHLAPVLSQIGLELVVFAEALNMQLAIEESGA